MSQEKGLGPSGRGRKGAEQTTFNGFGGHPYQWLQVLRLMDRIYCCCLVLAFVKSSYPKTRFNTEAFIRLIHSQFVKLSHVELQLTF